VYRHDRRQHHRAADLAHDVSLEPVTRTIGGKMSKRSTELLYEALEEAALAGAKEIKEFLGTYRGKDPERLKRVQIAIGAVSGYTRWRASHNNMISMMLIAARQIGISSDQLLEITKAQGLLPANTEKATIVEIKKASGDN
jgi:hypothetical protein